METTPTRVGQNFRWMITGIAGTVLLILGCPPAKNGDGMGDATVIAAKQGGRVQSADGLATLDIPPNALAADTMISLKPITEADLPDAFEGVSIVGPSFRLEPSGLTFAEPVTLTIDLGQADDDGFLRPTSIVMFDEINGLQIADSIEGNDESRAQLHLDPETNHVQIVAPVLHFSVASSVDTSGGMRMRFKSTPLPLVGIGQDFTAQLTIKNLSVAEQFPLTFELREGIKERTNEIDDNPPSFVPEGSSLETLAGTSIAPGQERIINLNYRCGESPGGGFITLSLEELFIQLPDNAGVLDQTLPGSVFHIVSQRVVRINGSFLWLTSDTTVRTTHWLHVPLTCGEACCEEGGMCTNRIDLDCAVRGGESHRGVTCETQTERCPDCVDNLDCELIGAGKICVAGTCVDCLTDADCADGWMCSSFDCVPMGELQIASVSYGSASGFIEIVNNDPAILGLNQKRDLLVTWAGHPTFPIVAVLSPPSGVQRFINVNEPSSEVIIEDGINCGSTETDLTFSVFLQDSNQNTSESFAIPVQCSGS